MKKRYIFLILVSMFFTINVKAAKLTDFKLWEGNTAHSWTTGNAGYYIGTSAYRAIQFSSDVLTVAESVKYQYGFISYCSYDGIYQSFYANSISGYGSSLNNLQMIDTGVKQKVYGSGSVDCTVKYITFSPHWNCGLGSSDACTLFSTTMITFYGTASDYQLLNYGLSSEPIIIDSSSGNILNQNNTIISQNNTLITKQDETNKKLDDVKDSITSEDGPKLDGLNNSAGWLPAGPLDSILNLPLSFLQNLFTNLSKTCQAVSLPLPFVNKDLQLPCLNTIYSQIDGLSVWINTIGVIASAFILFTYLINLYKWVDDTLTFRENNYIDNWGGI